MWATAAQPRVGLTPMIPTPRVDSGTHQSRHDFEPPLDVFATATILPYLVACASSFARARAARTAGRRYQGSCPHRLIAPDRITPRRRAPALPLRNHPPASRVGKRPCSARPAWLDRGP